MIIKVLKVYTQNSKDLASPIRNLDIWYDKKGPIAPYLEMSKKLNDVFHELINTNNLIVSHSLEESCILVELDYKEDGRIYKLDNLIIEQDGDHQLYAEIHLVGGQDDERNIQ